MTVLTAPPSPEANIEAFQLPGMSVREPGSPQTLDQNVREGGWFLEVNHGAH